MAVMAPPDDLRTRAPVPEGEEPPWYTGPLREVRALVQELSCVLESVRSGATSIEVYADYVRQTIEEVDGLLDRTRNGLDDIENGDTLRQVHSTWRQMKASPLLTEPRMEFEAQEQLQYLDMLDAQSRRLLFGIGLLTIPARVNDWLGKARPGYYIPFHPVFEDELPRSEDRVRLLNYLAWAPKVVHGGLVDAAGGLIYRYSRSGVVRAASFLLLAAALALAVGVIWAACHVAVNDWPLESKDFSVLLIAWVAVLVGVVVHAAVGTAKRSRAQGRPPIIAVEDIALLINAKAGQIMFKIVLTLVALFGLVGTAGAEGVTALNAFLLGYGLDSVVEVFGASMEQQAAGRVAAIRGQLGLTEED